jgi:hypothetical protein
MFKDAKEGYVSMLVINAEIWGYGLNSKIQAKFSIYVLSIFLKLSFVVDITDKF